MSDGKTRVCADQPRKVLLLHDYGGDRGGAEQIALDLRRLLRARGIETRLMTTDADPWNQTNAPDIATKGGHGPKHTLRETWNRRAERDLAQAIANFAPDFVHIVMFLSQLSPSILRQLKTVPTVYSINTYRAICPTGLRWRPSGMCQVKPGLVCANKDCVAPWGIAARLSQLAALRRHRAAIDRVVVPSRAMGRILAAHGWHGTDFVPHAVAPHQRSSEMSAEPTLAFAGRLVPEKGVDWLLRGFAKIASARPSAQVRIVGDGPDRARLTGLAHRLGIAHRVEFVGHVSRGRSQELLEAAWVQAVPSLWAEPFGLVAAEALARGTPAIVSDAGGPAEIVDHGATGWVVPTGDVGALARALNQALSDRAQAVAMGQRGVSVAAERYHEDAWIERYLDIYRDMRVNRGGTAGQ